MKTFVVDSSVCLKWVLDDEIDTEPAKELQKRYLNEEINLIAPDLWFYEILNILKSTKLRKPSIPNKSLETRLLDLLQSSPSLIDMSELGPQCLKYAINLGITAYDSAYITLAHAHGFTLITADNKLASKINNPELVISLKDIKIN
ncbi:MAG: hypothetical protein UU32_C0012G0005 [Candidatus Woesebacteria bacterium GW2011_GWB1_41_10]|uniref:PIN domain-containing protein n=1 Tax=Candidatus Woesebacteria bacterium GW2011_GWB1_41_10 TaxID=1618577 RepID=A0A0G0XG44_9BACT|nr:MAG: hypothetical protein UU32_C0012G0005 [Candidatus Woesebacteria bacterium GW2011_GWB1_41_10]